MTRILLALATAAGSFAGALAQSEDTPGEMSCADYSALEGEARMEAAQSLNEEVPGARDTTTGDQMSTGELSAEVFAERAAAACDGHPDMTVGEAMQMMEDEG